MTSIMYPVQDDRVEVRNESFRKEQKYTTIKYTDYY